MRFGHTAVTGLTTNEAVISECRDEMLPCVNNPAPHVDQLEMAAMVADARGTDRGGGGWASRLSIRVDGEKISPSLEKIQFAGTVNVR